MCISLGVLIVSGCGSNFHKAIPKREAQLLTGFGSVYISIDWPKDYGTKPRLESDSQKLFAAAGYNIVSSREQADLAVEIELKGRFKSGQYIPANNPQGEGISAKTGYKGTGKIRLVRGRHSYAAVRTSYTGTSSGFVTKPNGRRSKDGESMMWSEYWDTMNHMASILYDIHGPELIERLRHSEDEVVSRAARNWKVQRRE